MLSSANVHPKHRSIRCRNRMNDNPRGSSNSFCDFSRRVLAILGHGDDDHSRNQSLQPSSRNCLLTSHRLLHPPTGHTSIIFVTCSWWIYLRYRLCHGGSWCPAVVSVQLSTLNQSCFDVDVKREADEESHFSMGICMLISPLANIWWWGINSVVCGDVADVLAVFREEPDMRLLRRIHLFHTTVLSVAARCHLIHIVDQSFPRHDDNTHRAHPASIIFIKNTEKEVVANATSRIEMLSVPSILPVDYSFSMYSRCI